MRLVVQQLLVDDPLAVKVPNELHDGRVVPEHVLWPTIFLSCQTLACRCTSSARLLSAGLC